MLKAIRGYFEKLRAIQSGTIQGLIKLIMILVVYQAIFFICPYNQVTVERPAVTEHFVAEALKPERGMLLLAHDQTLFYVGTNEQGEGDLFPISGGVLRVIEMENLSTPRMVYHFRGWFIKGHSFNELNRSTKWGIKRQATLYVPKGKLRVVYFDWFAEMGKHHVKETEAK